MTNWNIRHQNGHGDTSPFGLHAAACQGQIPGDGCVQPAGRAVKSQSNGSAVSQYQGEMFLWSGAIESVTQKGQT